MPTKKTGGVQTKITKSDKKSQKNKKQKDTKKCTNKDTKKRIYESFKPNDNFIVSLEQRSGKNSLGFTDSENQKNLA